MKYVFDIDGTICTNTYGEYNKAQPYLDRIEKVNELYHEGNVVIFNTARGMGRSNNSAKRATSELYDFTKNQLDSWGVKYHHLFMGKPSGDIYVDDRGIKDEHFFGDEART